MSKESGPSLPKQERSLTAQLLKGRLLGGELTPGVFLAELRKLDQSTPNRERAIENVEVLTSEDVERRFVHDPENKDEYFNMLSLSHFHCGQIEAALQGENDRALESFKKAYDAAQEVGGEGFAAWESYVAGTVAFFEGDSDKLKELASRLAPGRNRDILANFLAQLESGEKFDYLEAYSK